MPARPGTTAGLVLCLAIGLVCSPKARGAGPADPLLKLVPPDAALTLAVEDLSGHAREFSRSPTAEGLCRLPVVKDWLASDRFRGFRQAREKAETLLGEDLATIRDGLLGEAFVLTLRLPPGGRPDEARGLLLARVPNRALLGRLIEGLNAPPGKPGERLTERRRGGTTYQVREFRGGQRVNECYAALPDRVFAWSNSEDLIRGVIDRQSRGLGGLDGVADFRKVRDRLPARGVSTVFVDPRFVERLLAASPRPRTTAEGRAFALFGQYLGAVRYAGLALEWRDGVVIHTEEVIDPAKLPAGLRRWAGRSGTPEAALVRVPPTALMVVSAHLDFGAVLDALQSLAPDTDRPRLDTIFQALDGLFLGLDTRADVIPHLGPSLLAYVEPPDAEAGAGGLPAVVSFEIGRGPGAEKAVLAIDNALRTLLALYALDESHGGGRRRVVARTVGGAKVTALGDETPWAYALTDGRLVVGNSAAAVARALAVRSEPHAVTRAERVRAAYFPGAVRFAYADLRAIHDFADGRRPALARRMAARQDRPDPEAGRDLDQALALIDLFDAAFLTSSVAPDFSRVHRAIGLVRLRPPPP